MLSAADVVLLPKQVEQLCGGLTQPARQLKKLHELGYWRAYIGSNGLVVIERAHQEAVSTGQVAAPPAKARRPKVRQPSCAA